MEPVSEVEVVIHSNHGEQLSLRGESVSLRPAPYDHRDYERLARDQARRLQAKCRGHAVGSTARTLYEQHLSFLHRLAETLRD